MGEEIRRDMVITDVDDQDIKAIKIQCINEGTKGISGWLRPTISKIAAYIRAKNKLPQIQIIDNKP